MFDKVIELINASTKVAFALALAAAIIFVGQYYQKCGLSRYCKTNLGTCCMQA